MAKFEKYTNPGDGREFVRFCFYLDGVRFRETLPGSPIPWTRENVGSKGRRGAFSDWLDKIDLMERNQDKLGLFKMFPHSKKMRRAGLVLENGTLLDKTVNDALDALVTDYRVRRLNSIKGLISIIKPVRQHLGKEPLATLTTAKILAYRNRRSEDICPRTGEPYSSATVNRPLTHLGTALILAKKLGWITTLPEIERLPEPSARDSFLTPEEFNALLSYVPGYIRPALQFRYITGWRSAEIAELRPENLDFREGTIKLEVGTTKNKAGRTFGMDVIPRLRVILGHQVEATRKFEAATGRPEGSTPWVFHRKGEQIKNFRKAWKTACRKALEAGQITGPKMLHDFRRTAVRNLEWAGVPRQTAMAMTGHKTESVYARYDIVDREALKMGGERLNAYLMTLGLDLEPVQKKSDTCPVENPASAGNSSLIEQNQAESSVLGQQDCPTTAISIPLQISGLSADVEKTLKKQ